MELQVICGYVTKQKQATADCEVRLLFTQNASIGDIPEIMNLCYDRYLTAMSL